MPFEELQVCHPWHHPPASLPVAYYLRPRRYSGTLLLTPPSLSWHLVSLLLQHTDYPSLPYQKYSSLPVRILRKLSKQQNVLLDTQPRKLTHGSPYTPFSRLRLHSQDTSRCFDRRFGRLFGRPRFPEAQGPFLQSITEDWARFLLRYRSQNRW